MINRHHKTYKMQRKNTKDREKVQENYKIGTRSVHVGSLSEECKDTPNYTSLLILL